jgi:glycerophosphoryl diester phosphodiesterase
VIPRRVDGRPLLIGHRGAAAHAPENTLESLRRGVELGCDVLEFDVVGGANGLVVAHDHERPPANAPPLADVLDFFAEEAPHVGLHVDVKVLRREAEIAEALRRRDLVGRAYVTSPAPAIVRAFARAAPDLDRGLGYPADRYGVTRRRGSAPVVAAALVAARRAGPRLVPILVRRAQARIASLHYAIVTPQMVARLHRAGVPVVAWTVNDAATAAELARAGVDGIVTDDPTIAEATLRT